MMQDRMTFALPTPKQMEKIDQEAAKTIAASQLMENAGWCVTREILRHYSPCRTIILCGPGNNGGDGYVVARLLAKEGWPVTVMAFGSPKAGSQADSAAMQWMEKTISPSENDVAQAELVIDAIFGAGLKRDLDPSIVAILKKAKRLVAIDIPSGVDGATGAIYGYAPHAELTVTFFRAKPGHYLFPGKVHIGKLVIKDIGIPLRVLDCVPISTWLNEPGLWHLPVSAVDDYKYRRGVVSIIGGAKVTGAARLSALSALNSGAGLVCIFPTRQDTTIYSLSSPCLMIDHHDLETVLHDQRRQVWVCGPGLTENEVKENLPQLLASKRHVVADAGAFLPGQSHLLKGVSIMTPHIGEFTRVFGTVESNRIQKVQQVAKDMECVVVLKGPDTIIAGPDGRVAINQHASSRLATAGSGDVLSGVIATFLAAGMKPWEAACAGVWVHGQAALLCKHDWPSAEMIAGHMGKARDLAKISEK
ncbi:NAD(P)H-hydrate dehydratase [Commensalibacter oyaizuii]|uniref:Bifunctional NAD(P)H-hydrate repair enzyme n=1 Tax=Commensalibacter oyaizuii TaxID=3043873 RepID=A0ABT6PZW4_9PROT|nr:NAD(P)H-hydrate dehydratase [Commensalibacter sp. TBRC 16381]MDI2090390.1 NAD(P)H-hydrate dehydratase [Commensalibacter sp. TBRC 16381]